MEIGVPSEVCVGTVRRELFEVNKTLLNELDSLKAEGKVNKNGTVCTVFYIFFFILSAQTH